MRIIDRLRGRQKNLIETTGGDASGADTTQKADALADVSRSRDGELSREQQFRDKNEELKDFSKHHHQYITDVLQLRGAFDVQMLDKSGTTWLRLDYLADMDMSRPAEFARLLMGNPPSTTSEGEKISAYLHYNRFHNQSDGSVVYTLQWQTLVWDDGQNEVRVKPMDPPKILQIAEKQENQVQKIGPAVTLTGLTVWQIEKIIRQKINVNQAERLVGISFDLRMNGVTQKWEVCCLPPQISEHERIALARIQNYLNIMASDNLMQAIDSTVNGLKVSIDAIIFPHNCCIAYPPNSDEPALISKNQLLQEIGHSLVIQIEEGAYLSGDGWTIWPIQSLPDSNKQLPNQLTFSLPNIGAQVTFSQDDYQKLLSEIRPS